MARLGRGTSRALAWGLLAIVLAAAAPACQDASRTRPPDAANATYAVERQSITLANGSAEQPVAPGSAARLTTRLSDRQAVGDVNGDGRPDVAVVLIHNPGGSGTFYYVAAVLNDGAGKDGPGSDGAVRGKPTNAVLLGDRIALEKVSIADGQIVVDYLERRSGEAMATPPSAKATKRLAVRDSSLAAVP